MRRLFFFMYIVFGLILNSRAQNINWGTTSSADSLVSKIIESNLNINKNGIRRYKEIDDVNKDKGVYLTFVKTNESLKIDKKNAIGILPNSQYNYNYVLLNTIRTFIFPDIIRNKKGF